MIRTLIRNILHRIFKTNSIKTMAISSSIGVLIGMLPLIGLRIPFLLAISLIFGLNIVSLEIGLLITIIFPIVHVLSMFIYQKIDNYVIPFSTLKFLYMPHILSFSYIEKISIISTAISGLFFSILLYPGFYNLYEFYMKRHISTLVNDKTFIFQDRSGKRFSIVKILIIVISIVSLTAVTMFGISISVNPFLPNLGFKNIQGITEMNYISNKTNFTNTLNPKTAAYFNKRKPKNTDYDNITANSKLIKTDKKVVAFYASWDDESLKSLKANYSSINIVVPDWYTLNEKLGIDSNIQPEVDKFVKSKGIEEMPLINNYVNNKWDSSIVHDMINVKNRKKVIGNIIKELKSHSYSGVNIDIENINENDKKPYVSFIKEMHQELNKNKIKLTIDLSATDDTLDYKVLSENCDYVILMVYDEHYESSEPGPVASLKWSSGALNTADIPPNKLIGCIGNYGYDWTVNSKKPAETVGYSDIMRYISLGNISIKWDKDSNNPYICYKKDGVDHIAWFLDGTTFYNQVKATLDRGSAGVAIWRLGGEDPTIWNVIKNISNPQHSLKKIKNIYCSSGVQYSGSGEILYVESGGRNGERNITVDSKGYINDVKYISMPSTFQIKRFGKANGKTIAITFDDGPDAYYTPRILDILKKYNVKASFFVVGENAADNPDIVQRIYKEGSDIGNHTFTHPNISEISPSRTRIELNTTQRLIQEITGHSTILFRPPYAADAEPSTPNEIIPIIRAQELGYVMIGELIDPEDWQSPKPAELYKRIINNIDGGNILLLHDAGGNRDSTLKVLPKVIEKLQKDGYKFVTVSQLMNKSRNEVMPQVKADEKQFITLNKAFFDTFYDWNNIVVLIFCSSCVLGILRMLLLVYLSYLHKKKNTYKPMKKFEEGVSVLVAAYNEEKVICKTLDSVLQSNFENLEIIVVDDGSTDQTLEILRNKYGKMPNIKILTKANGGKTSALNLGFKKASHDVIVTIDADTILEVDTIELLSRHFNNSKVAAVSGNIKVGNINNPLTVWQHIEYVTGFNLEKRAFALLNCITVVPGAISAWRKSVVEECGYFSDDTLAEDTDMTLTLLKKGYKVSLEEKAKAYTEAPEDIKSLVKQRHRWCYGILQCMWKHKNALFNSKYKSLGFFAMPSMLLFQYIFLTLSPIGDIYFIFGMFTNQANKLFAFYLVFLIVDCTSAAFAFNLETENKKPLKWLLIQRILYRLIMVHVVVKSIISVVVGKVVGWNKLKRKESVEI
ncbi:MAG TPA: polysaccharide deacetylase family protein [Clostridium sp.]